MSSSDSLSLSVQMRRWLCAYGWHLERRAEALAGNVVVSELAQSTCKRERERERRGEGGGINTVYCAMLINNVLSY